MRNIANAQLVVSDAINLIHGKNGSGKTTILEALYMIARGRSFRGARAAPVIKSGEKELHLFSEFHAGEITHKIGIRKTTSETEIRLDGQNIKRLSQVAAAIPLQIITPQTYQILDRGPEFRRKFIEWGVFHVEHLYSELLRRYLRALSQRNAALKTNQVMARAWDKELTELGEQINSRRVAYLNLLTTYFEEELIALLGDLQLQVNWKRGWQEDISFAEALEHSFQKDCEKRYTTYGPHRADLEFKVDNIPISQFASRGQQKLVITALSLAQMRVTIQQTGKKPVMLIDDLAAELDRDNRTIVFDRLREMGSQVFLTTTDADLLEGQADKMFHVEHGAVL